MIFKKVKGLVKVLPFYLFTLLPLFTACSPESFEGADPNGIPTVSGVDFNISVDQETNQMVATYTPQAGTYPVWILNGNTYSTLQEVGYQNPEAGTYTIDMKLGNRNGFSQAVVSKTFTFNETKIDYSADFKRITGKEWRFANKEAGHLGCGPSGTAGTEWWSAAPDDKKATGMYDDRISFTADTRKGGTFTYNAGEDGLTYINKGVTKWGTQNDAEDVDVTIGNQTSTWYFEPGTAPDGTACTYIVLAPNTAFPYITDDVQYENPKFRIEQLTAKKLVLVFDNPGAIAWHFIFTSEEAEKEWSGFDANSDFNMWKNVDYTMFFWYAPGWNQIADPGFKANGNDYTITLPEATTDQWMAQVAFKTTNISTNAATNYDFSCIINSDKDLNGATVKLVMDGDDNVFYFTDRIDLKAGEDYIFWKSDMPGIDMERVNLFFDFGGCQAGTNVNISDIVLKNHADDDGTKVPDDNGGGGDKPTMDWDYESGANLWKAVDDGTLFGAFGYWFADNGWGELPNQPAATLNGDTYEITLPEGIGGSQWQGQFHIDTYLTALASKAYNFYLVMEADNDCPGVTIKLTDSGDSNFFCEGRHDIKADEPFIFKLEGATLKEGKDAESIRLFFDFGGSPAGTHVKISKIYFEEAVVLNYDDASNLWKGVDDGTVGSTFGYWFANDSWTEIAHNDCKHSGDTYEIKLPEGMGGSQWQGQFHIDTQLTASASKLYHFQLVIEADTDCPGVTIKLTDAGDSNFFCEGRHDIKADEPYVYTLKNATLKEGTDASAIRLFFDFGGSPAGTNVKISKIIFKEAE
jgi:hypothetical protein